MPKPENYALKSSRWGAAWATKEFADLGAEYFTAVIIGLYQSGVLGDGQTDEFGLAAGDHYLFCGVRAVWIVVLEGTAAL